MRKPPKLTPEDEAELLLRFQESGDMEARNRLIERHMGLVYKAAWRYARAGGHFELDDLISEGVIGLCRGLELLDLSKAKPSTYLYRWITQSMGRAIEERGKTVRVPLHLQNEHRKASRASAKFQRIHGRYPTAEELTELTNLNLREATRASRGPLPRETSLDKRLRNGDESSDTLGDLLPDERGPRPDAGLLARDRKRILDEVLAELPERERKALLLRASEDDLKLQDIGDQIGCLQDAAQRITRERARQLIQNASRKAARRAEKLGYSAVDVF